MGEIIHLNEKEVKSQLSEMVRETVEKTLNQLLDAEADEITQAHRYERTEERVNTRAGHYHRKLVTKAGTVDMQKTHWTEGTTTVVTLNSGTGWTFTMSGSHRSGILRADHMGRRHVPRLRLQRKTSDGQADHRVNGVLCEADGRR